MTVLCLEYLMSSTMPSYDSVRAWLVHHPTFLDYLSCNRLRYTIWIGRGVGGSRWMDWASSEFWKHTLSHTTNNLIPCIQVALLTFWVDMSLCVISIISAQTGERFLQVIQVWIKKLTEKQEKDRREMTEKRKVLWCKSRPSLLLGSGNPLAFVSYTERGRGMIEKRRGCCLLVA